QRCVSLRLGLAHPRAQVIVDVHLEMRFEFLGEFVLPRGFAKESSQPYYGRAEVSHNSSFPGFKNRAMIPVGSSHCRASWASCFRPARVSESSFAFRL